MKKNFWDRMARNYDRQVNAVYKSSYEKTNQLTSQYLDKNLEMLDFACGTGLTTLEAASQVKKIVAIDISEKMIEMARLKAEKHNIDNIDFRIEDIFSSRFVPESFDVITAYNVFLYIKELPEVLDRLKELLKPKGILLSATDCFAQNPVFINKVQLVLSRLHILPPIQVYDRKKLLSILQGSGFEILETADLYDKPVNLFIAARKRCIVNGYFYKTSK